MLREISKDIEDIDGDYKAGMNTLPIVFGRERATRILFVLSFIPSFVIGYYVINSLYKNQLAVFYFLILIIGPLIYTSIKIYSATTKRELQHISNAYKLIMLFGMLSLLLYLFLLKN